MAGGSRGHSPLIGSQIGRSVRWQPLSGQPRQFESGRGARDRRDQLERRSRSRRRRDPDAPSAADRDLPDEGETDPEARTAATAGTPQGPVNWLRAGKPVEDARRVDPRDPRPLIGDGQYNRASPHLGRHEDRGPPRRVAECVVDGSQDGPAEARRRHGYAMAENRPAALSTGLQATAGQRSPTATRWWPYASRRNQERPRRSAVLRRPTACADAADPTSENEPAPPQRPSADLAAARTPRRVVVLANCSSSQSAVRCRAVSCSKCATERTSWIAAAISAKTAATVRSVSIRRS